MGNQTYDVIICGGGLAGQTLARQLTRAIPDLSVIVIEKVGSPLPVATLKVGESTVEVGGHYLAKTLGLEGYMEEKHLPKLGLRFFFGNSRGPFWERPEFGEKRFTSPKYRLASYQLDRGILENDLRRWNLEEGVLIEEGGSVEDIVLGSGDEPHRVTYKTRDGDVQTLKGRWVVDALGRRRLLQKKLGLHEDNGHRVSSVWFRMEGRIDVDDLVPASETQWHARVPEGKRYFSTNHLIGKGYWVWLIPLSSSNTSIGIVAAESIHPFSGYATFEKAMGWLKENEPSLAAFLDGRKPMDFKKLKDFSYSSKKLYSAQRWSCVGEAGLFPDPLYSPGMDFVGIANTITTEMILADREGRLTEGDAEHYNRLYLTFGELTLDLYKDSYPLFGTTHVMTAKLVWDWALYWGIMARICMQDLLGPQWNKEVFEASERIIALQREVQALFRDWAGKVPSRDSYRYLVPLEIPFLRSLYLSLREKRLPAAAFKDLGESIKVLEELAWVLSRQALSEAPEGSLTGIRRPNGPSETGIREQMAPIFGTGTKA